MSTASLSGPGPNGPVPVSSPPLAGLRVIDLSTTMPGALATQFLADAGADVVGVEPPGGSPLRRSPAWPAVGGGRRSVVVDLHHPADRDVLDGLLAGADVVVTTLRPRTARRLGLGPDDLARHSPRLVSVAITGWGSAGPWADLKGYEALVMAKLGMFHAKRRLVSRPGPAYSSVAFATWGAAHTAVQGIVAALVERESSGRGQHVEADLVRGVSMIDTWSWFEHLVAVRFPDAYRTVDATTPAGDPVSALVYPLLVAPTRDGHWLQFAQVEPRLFAAMLAEFGLTPLLADPKWAGLPVLETQELRTELWEIMIRKVGERTLADWQQVFATNPDINAEVFTVGSGVLDHPQIRHDGRVVVLDTAEHGPVRRPTTLVHVDGAPLTPPRPAPRLDEHGADLRAEAAARSAGPPAADPPAAVPAADPAVSAPVGPPLAGVTILEFGLMFAAPFGTTMLADLGARVIKVETLAGDTIRRILPFPELGAVRVMQGKESIALDLDTDEGRCIVHELARRSDVVLQAFRAGAAARAGVDAATLRAVNPDLIYVNAPGYGTDGPCGDRPAYAPSIGAATGIALTEAPSAANATSLAEIKSASVRIRSAAAVTSLQADGLAALGVASAISLGLLARTRGHPLGPMTVTMIATGMHALLEQVVEYAGRPARPVVDEGGHGLTALYRMYPAARGWVFLASPTPREWAALVATLAADPAVELAADPLAVDPLAADPRFATAAARAEHDHELAVELGRIFATRPAAEWEQRLTAADVGCVEVTEMDAELQLQTDPALAAEYASPAVSPIFDDHLRMGPPVRFSRSATRSPGGCLAGEHTEAILRELGYGDEEIKDLRARAVIG
ncbi:putative acyl-CoA transferase/carnitine dehydratase [Frankia torreyi]|uniref:Putative acyl-CoA transferase/carnitine dehydratase n=1 Tax=Frankia torreyi TaxID=1856 RepID=A0A0D8BGN7_9ACTN|nr:MULTISPECIES: CoA transferase [Frankia]KJE23438.1 putative acyl-CoA transferase/carnitine dehydratase [Frankia torreyi]KQM05560.1 putative acyl-CoA transferase/carnitine dehydratase [Frankia sp. CpI1-P]